MGRNPGKLFEEDFKASVPEGAYFYRLKDGTAWSPGSETRFTPSNDYDCLLYRYPKLWCLELKSVAGASVRYDALRPQQLAGLTKASRISGVGAGVVVNLRGRGIAAFVPIEVWAAADFASDKKSFNLAELVEWRAQNTGVILIPANRRVTRWRYDLTVLTEGKVV